MADQKKIQEKKPAPDYPDTPSGRALAEVGGRGPEFAMDGSNQQQVLERAAAYEAAKKKVRWG